jgi:hypothetical protein
LEGRWSEDGRYFVYNALDENEGASYLFLWQPESGLPTLIHAAASKEPFTHFTWLPDSQSIYFTLGDQSLWRYVIEDEELNLLAGTIGES